MTDPNNSNFKNNFNTVIAATGIEENHINSGCIYNNINNQRQNFTLQLFSVVANIKPTISSTDQPI